jgi:hypothetical protein
MPPPLYDNPNATLFIDVYSLPGSWKDVIPYCLNIQTRDEKEKGNEISDASTDARRAAPDNQGG